MPTTEQTASYVIQDINSIFQAALTCENEEDLGAACIQVAIETTDSKMGFIAEVGDDGMLHDIAMSATAMEACTAKDGDGHGRRQSDFAITGLYGQVFTSAASLIVNEPESHPARAGVPSWHPRLFAFLGVPLKERGRTFGIIGVANRPGGYGPEQRDALEGIAPAVVQAFKRKRVELALKRSEEKYRSLFQSIDEGFCIVEVMFDQTAHPYDYRFLETNVVFEQQSGMSDVVGKTMRELMPEHDQSWFDTFGRIALTGRPERFVNEVKQLGRVWDVYGFRMDDPRQRHVAVLFRDITERVRNEAASQFLAGVTDELARMKVVDETMNLLVERMGAHFRAARVVLAELDDPPGATAKVLYEWHDPALRSSPDRRIPHYSSAGYAGMSRVGQSVVVTDTEAGPRQPSEPWPDETRSFIDAPFVSGGRWRFSLVVSDSKPREWRNDEIRLVNDIGTRIWNSLDRARNDALEKRRLEEAQRRAEKERRAAVHWLALSRIETEIHSSLDIDQVAQRALYEGAWALGADSAAIDGVDDDGWVVWYDHGFDPSIVGHRYSSGQSPHGQRAVNTGSVVVVDDTAADTQAGGYVVDTYGLRSFAVAPLIVRGSPLGALYFNYLTPHRFTQQEVDFIARLASSLSLAIDNAHLFQTEHGIASLLQDALLSMPEQVPGIEFSHAYHSATETAWVGGDFYDLFELNEELLGIVIGDVAGKGLDAAVLTSMVKNTIRAHATERGKTPSRILELTNEVVFRATTSESFVTVFFGMLDRKDGRLVYANGGHTTCIILTPDGSTSELEATGPVLGAFGSSTFEESETHLEVGDVLFLYTDGLTEARRGQEFYGEERLLEFLGSLRDAGATGVVERVIDEVMAFTSRELRDDLALLAVRRIGAEESVSSPKRLSIGSCPSDLGPITTRASSADGTSTGMRARSATDGRSTRC